MIFTRKHKTPLFVPDLIINDSPLQYSKVVKFLGVMIDTKLSGKPHFEYVIRVHPINILLDEAKEPPLQFRFTYLTSKLVKNISQEFSSVTISLDDLITTTRHPSRHEKACKHIPSYKHFQSILGKTERIHCSFNSLVHIIRYTPVHFHPDIQNVNSVFLERTQDLKKNAISFYTDGSKDDSGYVGAGVYSPDLDFQLQHKLPIETTIFSAEAWAILQALLVIGQLDLVIFSDSKSVLDNICSNATNQQNYIIPRIKEKMYQISCRNINLQLAWIPSHRGITGG
ncbi:uncharacterized protein [Temnothorax longispinosus]|uniref:uncharacterized protein n=1 Tax=Temnothorax longispinosus TaxID=300112 RepID=UPI003A994E40